MSDSFAEEAPIYHKSLTPESPRPLHVPSPANIPILEHQIEPIFNLISTHTEPPYAARDLTQMDSDLVGGAATMTSDIPAPSLDTSDKSIVDGSAPQSTVDAGLEGVNTQSDSATVHENGQTDPVPNADSLSAGDPAAIIMNNSSHAANSSMPVQAVAQTAQEPSSGSVQPVQDSAAAQMIPQLFPPEAAPGVTNVADDGMQALLNSLSAPRSIQPDNVAVHTQESGDTTGNNAETRNDDATASMAADQGTLHTETVLGSEATTLQHVPYTAPASSSSNAQITATVDSYQLGAVPPPGLETNALPGLSGGVNVAASGAVSNGPPVAMPPTGTAGAPGVTDPTTNNRDADVEARYTAFLDEESVFTAEGAWEKFPQGSRLFVGNLPTEAVTKRDIWNIFDKYGKLAQIAIKQAYGFVQFMETEACQRAMKQEQGARIKERNMHLEVSKPPKGSRNAQASADGDRLRDRNRRNRSKSPERRRGQRGGQNRNAPYSDYRDDQPRRGRDDYRPGRSPSPRRRGDDYRPGRDRSPDRFFDGRRRSRSPYGRGYGHRSPSPRRQGDEDDLPLPKRAPRDVPDVQIILLEDVNHAFIEFVVRGFRDEGLRVDVLNMPRVSLEAVITRQIVEGVHAVCKLTRNEERTGKVPLTVFDRSQGSQNVRFDEYENLEMQIVAKLAARAKAASVPQTPTYGAGGTYVPPYMQQQQQAPPQIPAALLANNPQLQHLISTMDPTALQQLLASMGQQQTTPTQPNFPQQQPGQADMSALLANMPGQQQTMPQAYQYQQQPQAQPSAPQQAAYSYPQAAYQWPQQQQPQQQQVAPPQHDVQGIMQKLAGVPHRKT